MSRRTLVNLVFFLFVFGVMMVWAVNNIVTIRTLENPYSFAVQFPAASGVKSGAEVAYLGVHYGMVRKVDLEPGGVVATLDIDKGKHIPEGSIARIFRKSAIGEPYIDFEPPDGFDPAHPEYIAANAVIPQEQTQIPLEFSELLRSASKLLSGIDPESAGILVHELALALDGRADDLRGITEGLDQLTATFVQHTDALDRLAENNTALVHVVSEHRDSLGSALTNLTELADSLKNAAGNTQVLLDRGTQLMTETADLVHDKKGELDCVLGVLDQVVRVATTGERLTGLATLLEVGPTGFHHLWESRDNLPDGVWARVNLVAGVGEGEPAVQYLPPKDLPPVPAVPPCQSPFLTAGDFEPASAIRPVPGGPSAARVVELALGLALVVAVTRRVAGVRGGRRHAAK